MNILILDDDAERLKKFRANLDGAYVYCVETADNAIAMLNTKNWDVVCLDHDLGGLTMVASGKGTGYEVAQWLSEHKDKQPNLIVLHSLNPAGRKNMKLALPSALEMPCAWDLMKIKSANAD